MRSRALIPLASTISSLGLRLALAPPMTALRSLLRIITGQQPVKASHHGRFGAADGRDILVLLPAAAERVTQIDERIGGALLSGGVFIFKAVLLTLGVHDVQEIGQSALVALLSQTDCALARHHRIGKIVQALLLRVEIRNRRIRTLHGANNRFAVGDQSLVPLQIRDDNQGIESAEIQHRPIHRGAKCPDVAAVRTDVLRLRAESAAESDVREKIGSGYAST